MDYKAVDRQHVYPKASIVRFYSKKRCVFVMRNEVRGYVFPANADNNLFIASRKWDERTEKCANALEAKFQLLSDKIIHGESLYSEDYKVLSGFYALISERSRARYHEFDDAESILDRKTINYSKISESEQDYRERKGIIFLRNSDDQIIDRVARGMNILQSIEQASISNEKWGIYKTMKDFIVSDTYHQHAIIPVSPQLYLARNRENRELNEEETNDFNRHIIDKSRKFIFSSHSETLNQQPR
jgi:hypothetical protein